MRTNNATLPGWLSEPCVAALHTRADTSGVYPSPFQFNGIVSQVYSETSDAAFLENTLDRPTAIKSSRFSVVLSVLYPFPLLLLDELFGTLHVIHLLVGMTSSPALI